MNSPATATTRRFLPRIFVQKHTTIITFFVVINLAVGLLFHKSLNVICVSEFFILAIYNITFWSIAAIYLERFALKWNFLKNNKYLLPHSSIGIPISLLNVVIGQGIIIFTMIYVYRCTTSPSFDFLNAALTNNIAINLLCYFALSAYFMQRNTRKKLATPSDSPLSHTTITPFISLPSNGGTQRIALDSINFIETSNNCIIIHTQNGKHVTYQSLKRFLQKLTHPALQRVHRSYAVNLNQISSVQKNKNGDGVITLESGDEVKLSRNYSLKKFGF